MENGTKLRLFYLYRHLVQHSDAEHPLSTPELIQYLKDEYEMDVNRTTIADDFNMMEKAGIHFEVIKSRQNKYYFDDRLFDIAELKILIDAVASSKFITEKKSKELIQKLTELTTDYGAEKLRRHITVEGRVKSENEKIYYITDAINEAIDEKHKISFQYTDYNNRKRKVLRNDGERYVVSPYALVWDGEFYYLIGYCDNRQSMRNFRIDRIYQVPNIVDETNYIPVPKDFNLAEYSRLVFRMFGSGKTENVDLLCETKIMKAVIDKFGVSVETEEMDEEHFTAHITVCLSPTFYRWVFGWNGSMKILGPEKVVREYKEMCLRALEG